MIEKRNKELKDIMTQPFIINHYVFLASEKLKEKLNEYYQSKNIGADEKILDMLDEIKNIAFADYSTLTEEYDELTK